MLVLQDQEVVADLVRTCSFAHLQVDEQPTKRSKKNDDKSAVAILKVIGMKEDLLPTNVTIDRGNLIRGVIRSWNKSRPQRRSSDARQLGCVFQDMTPAEVYFSGRAQSGRGPIQRVQLTKAIARHTKIRDQNPSLGYNLPR